MTCTHDGTAEPVVLPPPSGEHVGYVCSACYASLPPWFGCPDCETETVVTYGGDARRPVLTAPCPTHQGVLP